jgi:hypothetical protein
MSYARTQVNRRPHEPLLQERAFSVSQYLRKGARRHCGNDKPLARARGRTMDCSDTRAANRIRVDVLESTARVTCIRTRTRWIALTRPRAYQFRDDIRLSWIELNAANKICAPDSYSANNLFRIGIIRNGWRGGVKIGRVPKPCAAGVSDDGGRAKYKRG